MSRDLRRVLIVSPNWPPISFPDLHRARMAVSHFHQFGWHARVLHLDPREQVGLRDETLRQTLPAGLESDPVRAIPRWLTSWAGVRSAGLRALPFFFRRGNEIIRDFHPDLIFFTTTMFHLTVLGPLWRRRFGVPFVVDYQDPWYAGANLAGRGSSMKTKIANEISKRLERYVMKSVAHVISVSDRYVEALTNAYPWLRPEQFTVVPFGVSSADFDSACEARQTIFDPFDGLHHWLYAGRLTRDMRRPLRALFRALRIAAERDARFARVRVHLAGTRYSAGSNEDIAGPIAAEEGVAARVLEIPERLPFLSVLKAMRDSHRLLVFGQDDPAYAASKLAVQLRAGKPVLAILREGGMSSAILAETGVRLVTFGPSTTDAELTQQVINAWFNDRDEPPAAALPPELDAQRMTQRLAEAFRIAI